MEKIQIGKKSSNLEPGYVWAPYVPMTTNPVIIGSSFKSIIRRGKINKIFNLGLDIKGDYFSPNKSLSSRYSGVQIKNLYQTIFVNDVT